jgi:hypothetical protein
MKTTWIIENLTREESYVELAKAVEEAGLELIRLDGDFSKSEFLQTLGNEPKPTVVCASIQMNSLIRDCLPKWATPPYCTPANYLCSRYYPIFDKYLFNDKYIMMPARMARKMYWDIYGRFAKEAQVFCRPNSGEKPFKAGLVDLQEFERFLDGYTEEGQLLLFSSPKNILGEWRFVVSKDADIIAQSSYKYQGLLTKVPSAPKAATDFVNEILAVGYYPDDVFCVDVALDGDSKPWLMELTSFSSAGLYACDKNRIVEGVSKIASKSSSPL